MKQTVLDGVVAIEAKAALAVEEAKARAKQARRKAESDLKDLARRLGQEAEQEAGAYQAAIESKKNVAGQELDKQLEAALTALEAAKAERVDARAEEVVRLLEQRADGH